MVHPTFAQRMGFEQSAPISDDFPDDARVVLAHLLGELLNSNRISSADALAALICRVGAVEHNSKSGPKSPTGILSLLRELAWNEVFELCERVYARLLEPAGEWGGDSYGESTWVVTESLDESRAWYSEAINELLVDRHIAYEFRDGTFHRRGRVQTQRNMEKVGAVLSQARLQAVRSHYNKARQFFEHRPEPDYQNCVKEAACALEACVETVTGKNASNFELAMKQLQGTGPDQVPPTIAQGMVKLHAFRGAARGAGHAALKGNEISPADAELVLSISAAYITYLADKFPITEEEVPF
jgi:hypothetical protein